MMKMSSGCSIGSSLQNGVNAWIFTFPCRLQQMLRFCSLFVWNSPKCRMLQQQQQQHGGGLANPKLVSMISTWENPQATATATATNKHAIGNKQQATTTFQLLSFENCISNCTLCKVLAIGNRGKRTTADERYASNVSLALARRTGELEISQKGRGFN